MSSLRTFSLIFLSWFMMGITMCKKKSDNSPESLKRAQSACIQAIAGVFPDKAIILKSLEMSSMTFSMVPGQKEVATSINELRAKPFISVEIDKNISKILGTPNLSASDRDKELVRAVESSQFWNEACGVTLKNEIQRCADKFEFDGTDWKSCMNSSPLAKNEWSAEWSPFFAEYYKIVKPKLLKMGISVN